MSLSQPEFEELLQRVRAGCPEAAQELFERYGDAVRRVVRRKLDQRLRRQFDSHDVAQSVWASFFQAPAGQYTFPSPKALVAFLSRLAFNKVMDVYRQRIEAAGHNITREQPLEEAGGKAPALSQRQPSPSQLAIAKECWERMLQGKPPHYRRILELLREGYSHREIAELLGSHPKVIQRLLRKLSEELELL